MLPADLAARYARYPGSYGFEILDARRSVVAAANGALFADIVPQTSESGRTTSMRDVVGGVDRIFESGSTQVDGTEYLIRVSAVGDPAGLQTRTLINEVVDHVMLPIVPLTGFLFLALWIALGRALAPVEAAARAVRTVDPAAGGVRLDLRDSPVEIAALGSAVNNLLDRLDEALKAHHDFAANVAHELRTPLALLTLDLERSTDDAAQRALADVQSMSRLVEQLLSYSRLEGLNRSAFAPVDLSAIARATAARLAPGAWKSKIELEVLEIQPAAVRGHAEAIESALRNLVENAVRVSPPGATVTITVGPGTILAVKDDGPGVAPERLAGLFERHVQGDRDTSGKAGLGLEITRRTLEIHGGRVEAESEPGRGATFRLVFPKG
jgi:signal transduction histidine kinase